MLRSCGPTEVLMMRSKEKRVPGPIGTLAPTSPIWKRRKRLPDSYCPDIDRPASVVHVRARLTPILVLDYRVADL